MGRKSAKIAERKGAADKARGATYTRALKDVFKASKSGSEDPAANFLLRVAVERAKSSMSLRIILRKPSRKAKAVMVLVMRIFSMKDTAPVVWQSLSKPLRTIIHEPLLT